MRHARAGTGREEPIELDVLRVALKGLGAFCLLTYLDVTGSMVLWLSIGTAFAIRAGAILKGWKLPKAFY